MANEPSIVRTASVVTVMLDRKQGRDYLTSGWSEPEANSGVWSLGHEAVLTLPAPSGDDLDLTFDVFPFITRGLPTQRVVVQAGGAPIGQWRLASSQLHSLHARLPKSLRTSPTDIELRFELPDADAPARRVAGSSDIRLIAIKLKKVEIRTPQASSDRGGGRIGAAQ